MNDEQKTEFEAKLTAYALGELDPAETAEVEALLRCDPSAQAIVAEVRAFAGDLTSALATEPVIDPRAPIPTATGSNAGDATVRTLAAGPAKIVRFPYYLVATLSAACFAALIVFHGYAPGPQTHPSLKVQGEPKHVEITLAENAVAGEGTAIGDNAASFLPRGPHVSSTAQPEAGQDKLSEFAIAPNRAGAGAQASAAAHSDSNRLPLPGPLSRGGVIDPSAPIYEGALFLGDAARSLSLVGEAGLSGGLSGFFSVRNTPLSSFSVDVNLASYANLRRFLARDRLPPRDAVHLEALLNYFPWAYTPPADNAPIAASMEVTAAPWNPAHRLVRIGLKGREVADNERPAANLVFVIDISGSMDGPNKLPLVKDSLRMLIEKLKPTDRIAIVTYGRGAGIALPSTAVENRDAIMAALEDLAPVRSGGDVSGLQLAYQVARNHQISGGANRVILCTDGDFNEGAAADSELSRLIEDKARHGICLSVLGFGSDNFKDATFEKLADKGNGLYGFIDSRLEARKLFVDETAKNLMAIARDVKVQVEFNPELAESYRLIGYETRYTKNDDFETEPAVSADLPSGRTVTALYEVVPVTPTQPTFASTSAPVKFSISSEDPPLHKAGTGASAPARRELLTLKVRYKAPLVDTTNDLKFTLVDTGATFAAASEDFKFAAAVAGFGMILKESPQKSTVTYDNVLSWAKDGQGTDDGGYRHEFIELVKKAKKADPAPAGN